MGDKAKLLLNWFTHLLQTMRTSLEPRSIVHFGYECLHRQSANLTACSFTSICASVCLCLCLSDQLSLCLSLSLSLSLSPSLRTSCLTLILVWSVENLRTRGAAVHSPVHIHDCTRQRSSPDRSQEVAHSLDQRPGSAAKFDCPLPWRTSDVSF